MLEKVEIAFIRESLLKGAGVLFTVLIENLNDKLIESYWCEFSDVEYNAQCLITTQHYINNFKNYLINIINKEVK